MPLQQATEQSPLQINLTVLNKGLLLLFSNFLLQIIGVNRLQPLPVSAWPTVS